MANTISDLKFDHKNARRRTDSSAKLIQESLQRYGAARSIVIDEDNRILAGNGTIEGAKAAGIEKLRIIEASGDELVAVRRTGLTEEQKVGLALADNRTSDLSDWDPLMLEQLAAEQDLAPWFEADELAELLPNVEELPPDDVDEDAIPEAQADPVSKPGNVWILGKHRVMCGDSTVITDVARLMAGAKAALLHADPPYGMGKASKGVANDNLYNDDLDAFQMEWWTTFRPFLLDNASAYVWGNAPELWRLWYKAGLGESEKMELRNQIVWDKKAIPGMASADLNQYPVASEHCLFFQIGNQLVGNMNTADYWEGWEPLRTYLEQEMKSIGWKVTDLNRVTNTYMGGHWVTRSQWAFPTAEQYGKIQAAAAGKAFKREYDQLKREYDQLKREYDQLKRETRSYFDNAHDVMRDVWEFSRVTGDERHGHATPKPVAMMKRVMLSSLPKAGLCVEPFGGSGSTLIGAEQTGRVCYAMELSPAYCDVIVKRWQALTGKTATLEATGEPFPAGA